MKLLKEYVNRYGEYYGFSLNERGNVDWCGPFRYCRMGYDKDSDDIIMVDPSGGPYIAVGYTLDVAGIIDRKVVGFKSHTDTHWEILLEPTSPNVP
jgi:hypothetical protein